MDWRGFEELARRVMGKYFSAELTKKNPREFPKKFDMVSTEEDVVGDAKYLTLVHRKKFPSAKMMEISGHVWLLEKLNAKTRFLVFGNQREVPALWLERYGRLLRDVTLYFIDGDENVEVMSEPKAHA